MNGEVSIVHGKVHIEVDNVGIHAGHCCVRHGCKYAFNRDQNDRCPVVMETVVQEHDCEQCDEDREVVERVVKIHTTIKRYCHICRRGYPKPRDINTETCLWGNRVPHKISYEIVMRLGGPQGYRVHQRGQIPNRQAAERAARKQHKLIMNAILGRTK